MIQDYPIDDAKVFGGDFTTWAKQSLEVSVEDVYPGKYKNFGF